MQTQQTDTTLPKAYLNYLMFDEGFNMLPDLSGAIQVEQANAWQNMDVPQFEIPQNGYLYIFTSNQSQTTVSTDNLYLYHWQSRLLEEFNYYPFGLTFEVTHAQNLEGSNVRYNSQSIERNEFTDNTNAKFGLNWYDFMARSYDVQIGRWMQPDPAMQHASPYLAMANNPTSFTDPLGLTAQDHIGIDIATGREVARAKSSGKDVYYSVRATGRDTWESLDILDNYISFGKLASSLGFTPETDDYSRADNLQINYAPNVVNHNRKLDEQNADRAKFNSVIKFNEASEINQLTGKPTGAGALQRPILDPIDGVGAIAGIIRGAILKGGGLLAAKELSVIGPRATYREFAKKISANFLDVTDEAWTMRKNVEFLQGVVKRGDDVIFSGKYNPLKLDPSSVLAQEIRYLQRHGYSWTDDFSRMIKK